MVNDIGSRILRLLAPFVQNRDLWWYLTIIPSRLALIRARYRKLHKMVHKGLQRHIIGEDGLRTL